MSERRGSRRMWVWILAWSVSTALLLWLIMAWTQMQRGVAVLIVLTPLVLGALALVRGRRRVSTAHGKYEIETQAARSTATLLVQAEPKAVRDAVRHLATGRFQLVGERGEELTLLRRMNLATWGMTLRLRVTPMAEGTQIHAREEPRLGTTIMDWGQGKRDIVHVFEGIQEQLAGPISPAL